MRLLQALGFPSCLLAAASCTVTVPTSSAWVTDDAIVERKSGTLEKPLIVTSGMGPVVVRLAVRGESGGANWSLVDPDGVVRWRCSAEPSSRFDEQLELPSRPGTWKVRREWSDFTGSQWLSVTSTSPSTVSLSIAFDPRGS